MDVPRSLSREDREVIAESIESVLAEQVIDVSRYDYFEIVYHRGSHGYQAVLWPMRLQPPERRWYA